MLQVALSLSAQGTMAEHHSLGGLNNRPLFLTVLEAEKSKTKVLVSLVLGKSSVFGLQTFSLCLHIGERGWGQ